MRPNALHGFLIGMVVYTALLWTLPEWTQHPHLLGGAVLTALYLSWEVRVYNVPPTITTSPGPEPKLVFNA